MTNQSSLDSAPSSPTDATVRSTAIAGCRTSMSVIVTTDGGDDALQGSTLADEFIESTTIEKLESTVRVKSDGVVAEEIARNSMMK